MMMSVNERVQEIGILLFADFAEIEPGALIAGARFQKQVGCLGIGLQVAVGQAVGHDKGHGIILHDVWPGENCLVDPSGGVGRSQHPMTLGGLKVRFQIHAAPRW